MGAWIGARIVGGVVSAYEVGDQEVINEGGEVLDFARGRVTPNAGNNPGVAATLTREWTTWCTDWASCGDCESEGG